MCDTERHLGISYSIAFLIVQSDLGSALFLTLGGILVSVVMVALYLRLKDGRGGFVLLALIWGIAGALGSTVHGAYDLANIIHPPSSLPQDLPSAIDPRGLLTFDITGDALLIFSCLTVGTGKLPKG